MSKASETKVLRVGIIQGGRIVEERILRKTAAVSIGQSPRNTFAIPLAHLPASYSIFEVKGGKYHLRFVKGMEGRVSVDGDVVHLKALVQRKLAQKQGKHFLYPLGEEARGKIVLGDVTLLFQFVPLPPPVSKLQLPAVITEPWWKRIDGVFAAILLLSLLFQGGAVGGLEYWWVTAGQFEKKIKPRPNIREVLPVEIAQKVEEDTPLDEKLLEPAEVEVAEDGETFSDEEEELPSVEDLEIKVDPPKALAEAAPKTGPASPGDTKKRYERQLTHVRQATILKFVGSAGGGPGGPPNTLAEGASGAKLSDAWRTKSGVAVASPGEHRMYQGVPKAAKTEDGEGGGYKKLASKGKYSGEIKTGKVATAKKGDEVKVKVKVGGTLGSKTGIGQIDKQSVASVFRRRRSAIRRCYEARLRGNPDLQGKVVIQFTIGTAGRITSIAVTSDTTGDGAVAQCIVGRVKGWRFDPPERGSVTFSYPFILSRG